MDLLEYLPAYRIVICKQCRTAVAPTSLGKHLRTLHLYQSPSLGSNAMVRKFVEEVLPDILEQPLLDPRVERIIIPTEECDPLPHLKVHKGFGCEYCPLVSPCTVRLKQHYNAIHAAVRRGRGGLKGSGSRAVRERLEQEHFGESPPWRAVNFQRFFSKGKGSTAFRVRWNPETQLVGNASNDIRQRSDNVECRLSVREEVFDHLLQLQHQRAQSSSVVRDAPTQSQASPWLERTRWSRYLRGVNLNETAGLIRLPDQDEIVLSELCLPVDRLVDDSYRSVCEDKINFFAQRCISSLLSRRKAYSQPLIVKLQKPTYQRYKELWKRLICFACRTMDPSQSKGLQHQLTARQTVLVDELLSAGGERVAVHSFKERDHVGTCTQQRVDDLCLDFCISLLDHTLKRNIYESIVLSFLAVLGIDTGNSAFHQAPNYIPKLSGFIKIGQMLVLQKAVLMVEKGEADNSLDPLDDMRQQFMTVDSCTPFSWAVSLRSFGKSIRDCVTSLGYIQWAEDGLTVFYRDLELQLSAFRTFVAAQVQHAQTLLTDLFLISSHELREDIIPAMSLYRIRDNPSEVQYSWNFLHDSRNKDFLPCKKGWLLGRVLEIDSLREKFVFRDRSNKIGWNKVAIRDYYRRIDSFLETLLLLVHITSGQPARGTEIIGLLHSNTTLHRNIFAEDGLISIVTSYHKGYTCTGSTRIIHRYLPKEVSELCVYYLWIILPFVEELGLLAPSAQRPNSSYLWPAGEGCWSSQRLSAVLKRATSSKFNVPLTVSTYRHVAIAFSRRHIAGGGFKRDYDTDKAIDEQATHTSWTAGRLYARGLEEAPGHVEARRAEFRAVSRRWHAFLGFASSVPASNKRVLADIDSNVGQSKRARLEKATETEDARWNGDSGL